MVALSRGVLRVCSGIGVGLGGMPFRGSLLGGMRAEFLPPLCASQLGLEGCVEGRLYDWSALAQHPDFRPSALQPRIVATYPDKLKEVFAGCLITSVSALLCLYTANKLALVGVGISVYATMSQGLKLAPWVGIVVSAALFVGGLVDVKPEARAAPADPPADPPAAAEPKKEK